MSNGGQSSPLSPVLGGEGQGEGPNVYTRGLTVGPSPRPSPLRTGERGKVVAAFVFAVAFFTISLPQLGRLEFANSIENIVVQTALETRRGGHWLVPRMLDEPRTRKPPLAAWASAACVRDETVRQLSDPATREAAYRQIAREIRLPALLAACATILLTFELGRLLANATVAAWAAVAAGTSLLFLECARLATPDTQLMLWVTACNVLLARAVLRGQWWLGCCGAGVCLGLALMSKGPVALLQTVVPVAAFVALAPRGATRRPLGPPLAGLALAVCVALPWYAILLREVPDVWHTWFAEVTRLDPADPRPDRWYANLQFVRHMLPWTPWVLVGGWVAARSAWRRQGTPAEIAFWLVVVPLVVMSFFAERKPRYLLPLVPAAAVLAATSLVQRRRATAVVVVVPLLAGGMLVFDAVRTNRADGSDMKPLADVMAAHLAPEARVWSVWSDDLGNNAPIDLSIYLNRVVAPAPSMDYVMNDQSAGAVVIAGRESPPRGSVYLGRASRGSVTWQAYLLPRPATSASAPE